MRRLSTIRVRATGASVGVLVIAFALAGAALLHVLRMAQIDSIDAGLKDRASEISSLIDESGGVEGLSVVGDSKDFIQVADPSGEVVTASDNVAGQPQFGGGRDGSTTTERAPGLDRGDFRVYVKVAPNESYTVIVGTTLQDADDVAVATRRSLLLGLPVLVGLIATLIWFVIGRALRPVEAIRSEVADIGGDALHRRVPEPNANDEIGRLARTMNAMLNRLERSSNAQAQFVSDASHELRTPIAVIRHELEVGLLSDDDVQLRQIAGEVLEEGERMQRLVDDLLLLARHDGRDGEALLAKRSLVDLDDVALLEAHRVSTTKSVGTSGISAGQVRGDMDQLSRVARNLIDNALRHAVAVIEVSVSSNPDGLVVLVVEDDGAGVEETDRERIFERFGRLDVARASDDGGSGLGLAIVAGIVADHGGTVTIDASPTLGGARFSVTVADART
ncbi:MAG: HAMP domain-containing sensor histidine kinase [Ilumatobacteraceae bacterium]